MSNLREYIRIDGMTCQSCVKNIENQISQMNGIQSIKVRGKKSSFFSDHTDSFSFQVSLENKSATVDFDSTQTHLNDIVHAINQIGFQASVPQSMVDLELGGISDENIPIAIERIAGIAGVLNVNFPLKNDSSHVKISFNQNDIDAYTLFQKIQSIGYKVHPKLENIARAHLRVQGMHCNSCVMNITQTVEDLPGIHDVKVTFDDQSAKILYDPSIIDLNEIIKEIEKLDFQVANNEIEPLKISEEIDKPKSTFVAGEICHAKLLRLLSQ